MVQVDEPVFVLVNQSGEPVGFQWRGSSYRIGEKPIRWFARRDWWAEATRAQRGIGSGLLEVEMWRLSATDTSGTKRIQFELMHQLDYLATLEKWRMVRVYN